MTAAVSPTDLSPRDPMARLTQVATAVALILVAVRMTMTEAVRQSFGLGAFADLPAAPGPTTTLVLDLLCWLPALLVLVRRAIDREYVLRLHASHLIMALLAVWVWASTVWAGDRFAAVINSSTWSAAMALGWAASQLVRSWARLRGVLALGLGLLMILIAQAAIYRYFEQPDTVRSFQSSKAEILAANHWSADDPIARQYEQKLVSGELIGFFKSPNTLAAAAALAMFVSIGFVVQRKIDGDPVGFSIALAAPVVLSMLLLAATGSRTAMAGAVLFLIILFIAWRCRAWLTLRAKTLFWAGCGLFVLGTATVVGIGLKTGGLIQDSLNFRWNYWVASWQLWLARPICGVGWSSFGDAYLKYRLPVAAEEIKDPHNVLVHFLTETGVVGLVLLIAWLGRSWFEMTRPLAPRAGRSEGGSIVPAAAAIAGGYFILRLVVGESLTSLPLLLNVLPKLLLYSILLLLGLVLGGVRGTKTLWADARPAPFLLFAAIAGLGGFFLHNLVDFAMFENGPLVLMMLVLGAVLGVRHGTVAGKRQRTWAALAGLVGVFVVIVAEILLLLVPVATAEAKAADADAAGQAKLYGTAVSLYREAMAASPVPNDDYPMRATHWMPAEPAIDVSAMLSQAIAANPVAVRPWLDLARLGRSNRDDPIRVAADYGAVIARNPNEPMLRLEYGDYLDSIGLAKAAAEQYRAALDVDRQMHADEPRRIPKKQRDAVAARLKAIE